MGLVSRQLRKGGNQRFAAPISIPTKLDNKRVQELIERTCQGLNKNFSEWRANSSIMSRWWNDKTGSEKDFLYYVEPSSDGSTLVSFGKKPDEITRIRAGNVVSASFGYWLAKVSAADSSQVTLTLLRWVTGDDGKIKQKDRYEQLVTELRTGL